MRQAGVLAAAGAPEEPGDLSALDKAALGAALDAAVLVEDYARAAAIVAEQRLRADRAALSARLGSGEAEADPFRSRGRPVAEGLAPGWQPPDGDEDEDTFVDERWA